VGSRSGIASFTPFPIPYSLRVSSPRSAELGSLYERGEEAAFAGAIEEFEIGKALRNFTPRCWPVCAWCWR
jgi:hypothetical protein